VPDAVHACPPDGSGLTPCCRRNPGELPRADQLTEDADAVTCASPWRSGAADINSATPTLREAIAGALRAAAFFCGDADCALTETECLSAHPVQVAAWQGDVVSDLYGPIDDIAGVAAGVVQPVIDELADYRHRINWETNCGEHARLLDHAYDETTRRETAEARIARLRQMADAWEQQLPDVIRTATAVEAIRMATGDQPGDGDTPGGDIVRSLITGQRTWDQVQGHQFTGLFGEDTDVQPGDGGA